MNLKIIIGYILLMATAANVLPQDKSVLIVTGGKDFEEASFFKMFDELGIKYDSITKPAAFGLFDSDDIRKYKAVIFYDLYRPISEEEKKSFLKIFELGIGALFLHHSIVSHQDWDEYEKIIGGKYFDRPYMQEEKKFGPSTYKHDQDFKVIILERNHPVTRGLDDFDLHDEIYINIRINKDITPLLSSNNGESAKYLGWTKTYNKSKIVYLQPGHDRLTYNNSSFRKLVLNSINWLTD